MNLITGVKLRILSSFTAAALYIYLLQEFCETRENRLLTTLYTRLERIIKQLFQVISYYILNIIFVML